MKAPFRVALSATLIAGVVVSAGAQRLQHPVHVIPRIPQALLERPVTLGSGNGIGDAHDAVATKSADAQRYYDQGLAYLHAYVWIEAARSFNQALRLDPALAIAYAGLSVAYVEVSNVDQARSALAQARSLAGATSAHDRRHIELRALQASAEIAPGEAARLAAYRRALDEAIAAFPKDVELLLLRGLAESADPGERGQGSTAASAVYYTRALAMSPGNAAAHHYLTHANENTGRSADALANGAAFAKIASAIPHARHMYGHSLRRAGRIDEAIAEFEAADGLHRSYLSKENIPPEYDWHFHHNLDLLGTSYQYVGRMTKAEATLKASFSTPSNLLAQLFNKREWPVFLRARGRSAEALDAANVLIQHPHPLIQAVGNIEAGYALLANSQFGDAGGAYNTALKILRGNPEGAPLAAPALLGLQGELALRTAQRQKGRDVLNDVAKRLRGLPGPDHWVQTLFALDAMAMTARAVGDWELAGEMAQQMLAHDAAYAGSHYASALVAEYNGDLPAARAAFARAAKYWAKADANLPELAEIRKRLK